MNSQREIRQGVGYRKILRTILSSTTYDHIETCQRMIDNYLRVYGRYSPTVYVDRANTLRGICKMKKRMLRGIR